MARVICALAVFGLLAAPALAGEPNSALAPADAIAPAVAKPWKHEPGEPRGNKAQLPRVEVPRVEVPRVKVPKVELPTPAQAGLGGAVQPPSSSQSPTPSAAATPASSQAAPGSTVRLPAGTVPRSGRRTTAAPAARPRAGRAAPARTASRRRSAPARPARAGPATRPRRASKRTAAKAEPDRGSGVGRTVREIVEVVPQSVKAALAALACLSAVLLGGYLLSLFRARRLQRQRGQLLDDVGLLQGALLPPVPETVGAIRASVAYRPADGLAAGGDFYDAIDLPGGRAGFILGDVSGHGRAALERTAFVRYTLRAYLEAGLEPRAVLRVAAPVVGEHLGGEFVTVLVAVHDPASGSLTWASAGHPAPILLGPDRFDPVTAGSSPPIGMGLDSGFRQTSVPLPPGSLACMYTDGLAEARADGDFVGREGLERMLADLGQEATATALIDTVTARARATSDDMAACLMSPANGSRPQEPRCEQLEVGAEELENGLAVRFLKACGVDPEDAASALAEAMALGGGVLSVRFDDRRSVELLDSGHDDIEAASRRIATA